MTIHRRDLLGSVVGFVSASTSAVATSRPINPLFSRRPAAFEPPAGPRSRVMHLNDLGGDIDGLFAAAHAILSPSTDLRGIVGTLADANVPNAPSVTRSVKLAHEVLSLIGRPRCKVYAGSRAPFQPEGHVPSEGAKALIAEASRTDTDLPLYVTVGGGLTEVAGALLMEPSMADRFTLVWIGGGRPHPEGAKLEPNFSIDPTAARFVFNETKVPIWLVPSEVYQTCLVSLAELQLHVATAGRIGAWLYDRVVSTAREYSPRFNAGATWTLGDNPLVLLTALNDWVPSIGANSPGPYRFERTGSSPFEEIARPILLHDGSMISGREKGRIRRYLGVDNRLMIGDLFAKLALSAT